jgi:hypothetical protein
VGSRRNPKLYKLVFDEDTEYPGLEVTLRSLTIGEMQTLRGQDDGDDDGVIGLSKFVAKQLVSWNREDEDGNPLPPTLDSLMGEEPSFVSVLVDKWTEAVKGVPAPLEQPSNDGAPSAVESIPMEPLSPSLAS